MKESFIVVIVSSMFVSVFHRMFFYAKNPSSIARDEKGKVRWLWCFFVNVAHIGLGSLLSLAVYIFIKKDFGAEESVVISSCVVLAIDRIWLIAQEKITWRFTQHVQPHK